MDNRGMLEYNGKSRTIRTLMIKKFAPDSYITARVLEKYYMQLMTTPAARKATDKKYTKKRDYVTAGNVKRIHNVLRSAFHQSVKWELMEKNPAIYATVPKPEVHKHDIWDAEPLFRAISFNSKKDVIA